MPAGKAGTYPLPIEIVVDCIEKVKEKSIK
jgi:hypothetical protein